MTLIAAPLLVQEGEAVGYLDLAAGGLRIRLRADLHGARARVLLVELTGRHRDLVHAPRAIGRRERQPQNVKQKFAYWHSVYSGVVLVNVFGARFLLPSIAPPLVVRCEGMRD